jgi:hypothetical protein
MLEWWPSRVRRVRDGDHIPVSPEMLPKNRIVGLADFPTLEVEREGYCRSPREVNGLRLTMNLRSFEKANLRAASIRSNESSESLILFVGTHQPFKYIRVSPGVRMLDSRREEVRTVQIMPIFLVTVHMSGCWEDLLSGRAGTHQVRDGLQQRRRKR